MPSAPPSAAPPATALSAAAVRTAEEFLPASRLRPLRELVELVGPNFCAQEAVLPLWAQSDAIVVATARPFAHEVLHELRARLGRPLIVRLTSAAELRIALANALGTTAAADWRRALAELLTTLRLLTRTEADGYVLAADDEPYLGASLVAKGLISAQERLEAVGLAFSLPSIDLQSHPPRDGLAELLPADVRRWLRVLPLWVVDRELFVGVENPPSADTMERLAGLLGLTVRPVLVAPGTLERWSDAAPDTEDEAGAEVMASVRRAGLVSGPRLATIERVAAQRGEPVERTIVRLGGIEAADVREALARTAGYRPFRDAANADPHAVVLLPVPLARRLGAVVVDRDGDDVTVAMADPWDREARRAIGALLDVTTSPLLAEPAVIEKTLDLHAAEPRPGAAPDAAPGRHAGGDAERSIQLLLRAGFVDPDEADFAGIDLATVAAQRRPEATYHRLTALLDGDQLMAATALDLGLPAVAALLLRPDPRAGAPASVAPDTAPLLPLLDTGEVLTVASSAADAAEVARLLGARQQRAVRLVASPEADLRHAVDLLEGLDRSQLSDQQVALGRLTERHGLLPRQVLAILRRMQQQDEPLDVAADRLRLLSPHELRDLLARLLRTDPATLHRSLRPRLDDGSDGAVQQPMERQAIDDPVDHGLACMLSVEAAARLGALPFRRHRGTLVLAMADPLDAAASAELHGLLPEPFLAQPATRSDIREASLRAHGRPTIGDLLFEDGVVTRAELERALELAGRSNVRVGEALVTLGLVSEEELGERLADQRGLPFVTVRGRELDAAVAQAVPEEFARSHVLLPIAVDGAGTLTVALADPTDEAAITATRELAPGDVQFVGTTRGDVRDGLERLYHADYLAYSASDLMNRTPEDSAYRVLSTGQKRFFISFAVFLVLSLAIWPVQSLIVMLALATGFYLAFSLYKFYLIYRALSHTLEVPIDEAAVAALDDRELPVYTLLIPLYRESEVLPTLVRGLERLEYPKEKLDVKLLLEEDDIETIAVARAANLPSYFDITIVPDGQPKGKPKACNYGLLHARGEYAVIYDAEDIPEPDQLKKVLVGFALSAPNVVCIQSKLNYYNRNQNVLTKWFTTEYSTWFDLFLPGLDASGAPIPLGGTSNHFRIEALRVAGAWDPFNVTEDADLGLRIFKLGGRTAVVDSTTFEEATSVLDNWIRQRSRWVKGYIQTWLVHMRHPIQLWQQLGTGGFISFQLVIGGTFFGFLLNPLLWGLTGVWFLTEWEVIQQVFPGPVYYMGAVSLYAGNFAFAYMNVAGCLRRRYYSLVKWALLSPIYWVLMSIAAWKGFLQLFYRPFYWEKTVHGLANRDGLEELADLTARDA